VAQTCFESDGARDGIESIGLSVALRRQRSEVRILSGAPMISITYGKLTEFVWFWVSIG
jgi:hypothetical protein